MLPPKLVVALAILIPCAIGLAEAPDSSPPTVTARGVGTKSFEPSFVQVRFELGGRGTTAAEAIACLEGMQRNLQSSIKALNSTGPRVRMSPPRQLRETVYGVHAQINSEIADQQAGKRSAMGSSSRRIGVDVELEWTLSGSTEQRLKQIDEIEDRLNLLVARPEPLTLGVTNEEPDESTAKSTDSPPSTPSPIVVEGLLRLEFVCRVSEEDQSALVRAAMERARVAAGEMAAASSRKLGALRAMTDAKEGMKGLHSDAQQVQRAQAMVWGSSGLNDDPGIFRSFRFAPIEVKYELSATFELE